MKHHGKIEITVVRFLGWIALILCCGVLYLVHDATGYDKIDPSTIALVSGVSTLAGSVIGALGAMLATANRGTTPVEVTNSSDNPVPTVEET